MVEINAKDARSQLSALLDRVEEGEEIIIRRRGKRIAKLVSAKEPDRRLSLKQFRASLKVLGKPMSQTVIDARNEDRY